MAKSRQQIEKEIQKTLDTLDHLESVEGNPFLYTRIKEQLKQETARPAQKGYVVFLRFAMVAVFLALNLSSVYFYYKKSELANQNVLIESLSSDYGLTYKESESDF